MRSFGEEVGLERPERVHDPRLIMSVTHLNPLAVKVDDTNVKLFDRPATVVIFHLLLTVVGLPHKAKSAF